MREFDTIWELPGVPRRFLFVTAVWGVALVAEAVVRTVLALTVATQTFLVITPIQTSARNASVPGNHGR